MSEGPRSVLLYSDSHTFGGVETAMFDLARRLDRRSWTPAIVLGNDAVAARFAERAGVVGVRFLQVPPTPLGLEGVRRLPALVGRLRAERPDVFHAHLSWPLAAKFALAAAVAARVPVVVATVHLIPPELSLGPSSRLQLAALTRRIDRTIAVSAHIAKELERFGWPPATVEVVRNSVDPADFASPADEGLRRELDGGVERPIVLTTARLDPQKGLPILLRAAAELEDVAFVIAGEGDERGRLEDQARRLGLGDRVRFLGHRADIPQLLATCDAFVLPSLYEGNSIALLEAMAAGRAVVTTDVPGTAEVIRDGVTGLLVPAGDSGALARALRRILADAPLRGRLGSRAREEVIRGYAPDAVVRRISEVYAGALAR